jgi:hypothetical protein
MVLLLDSQGFGGGFQNHSVNLLFGHRDIVEADGLVELVAFSGFLLVDHHPILLFHGIAPAFVEAGRVGFLRVVVIWVIECLAEQNARACTGCRDKWIAFAEFVSNECANTSRSGVSHNAGRPRASGKKDGCG